MVRTTLTVLVAGSFALVSAAAAQYPDFSGTWKINASQSDAPPQGRGGGGGGGSQWAELVLQITQSGDKLVIEQQGGQGQTLTYYLDGRESANAGMRGAEMKSTSKWDGSALVTMGTANMETPRGAMQIEMKETRSLSDDGKTMTVVSVLQTPRGERTRTTVFEKQ